MSNNIVKWVTSKTSNYNTDGMFTVPKFSNENKPFFIQTKYYYIIKWEFNKTKVIPQTPESYQTLK